MGSRQEMETLVITVVILNVSLAMCLMTSTPDPDPFPQVIFAYNLHGLLCLDLTCDICILFACHLHGFS